MKHFKWISFVLLLCLSSCDKVELAYKNETGTVTLIKDFPREGHLFYGITLIKDAKIIYSEVPEAFRQNGLQVKFSATAESPCEGVSCSLYNGTAIYKITKIEKVTK